MNNPICCFCGKPCENEYGNNPWPLSKNENDRCCNECNSLKVIPARLGIENFDEEVPDEEDIEE